MDAVLASLFARLAEMTTKRTATAIIDKIAVVKAKKQDAETIQVLSEIINSLISDREELIIIAQGLKEQLVSQQISDSDIRQVVETALPVLRNISAQGSEDPGKADAAMATLQPLLSQDTLKVLQILGFNYREAIGEPLTQVVRSYVCSLEKRPSSSTRSGSRQKITTTLRDRDNEPFSPERSADWPGSV